MFVTLYAIVCLNLAAPGSCVRELVVDTTSADMSYGACQGYEGQDSARRFVAQHPLYRTWKFKGWACQWGNRAPPAKGRA
jgi:hypothetical protein